MNTPILNVLLIDDDEDDYVITRDLLSDIDTTRFELDWTSSSGDGLAEMLRTDTRIIVEKSQLADVHNQSDFLLMNSVLPSTAWTDRDQRQSCIWCFHHAA